MSQFISKFGPVVIVSLLIPWTTVHAFVPSCTPQPHINSHNRCSSHSHSHSIVRRIPRHLRCQSTDTSSSVQSLTTKSNKSHLQQPPTSDCVDHDPSTPTSPTTSTSSSSSTVTQVASFGPPPFDVRLKDDSEERNRWIARIILITVAAFYGTNFGCVKILNDSLEPSISALSRFTLASLVFSPYVVNAIKTKPQLVLGGLEVGIYNALGYFFQALSLETTSASTVAFICSLAVVVVPLIGLLLPENKDGTANSGQPWYGPLLPALLAAAGVGCLELGGTEVPGVGDLLALGQPLFFGYAFYRIEHLMKGCRDKGDAQAFTGAMMVSVAVGSLAWATHDFILPHLHNDITQSNLDFSQLFASAQQQMEGFRDWKVIAAIAWTGVVTTALTAYGENYAMKSLSAAESTVIYSTEPLWGTAFAALVLGEHVGLHTFVGAALILSACVWSSVGPSMSLAGMASSVTAYLSQGADELSEQIGDNWSELMSRLSIVQSSGVTDNIPPEL